MKEHYSRLLNWSSHATKEKINMPLEHYIKLLHWLSHETKGRTK